jgi:hypothetical protein
MIDILNWVLGKFSAQLTACEMRLVSNPTALRQLVINLPLGAYPQILVWLSAGALIKDMKNN